MTIGNRTNEPTPEQVEAAAKAMHGTGNPWFAAYGDWGASGFEIKKAFRDSARAALVAAQGAARPVNGFDTTAERVKTGGDSLHVAPQVPNQNETKSGNNFVSLDPEKVAEIERAAAAQARGEAIVETVQAHRDLHKTYGSTSACRGGVGGQALTSHCAEICYNAGAHEKEMEAWQRLEVEAIEYSRARAAEIREGKLS